MTAAPHTTNRAGWIVLGLILAVAAAIVVGFIVSHNNAAAKEQERQREHDSNVSWYTDRCTTPTGWAC